jgi:hypothetical protein
MVGAVLCTAIVACGTDPCGGGKGSLKAYLADVEVWLEAMSIPAADVPDEATVTLDLPVAPVARGGAVGSARTLPVAIHSWFVEDVRDALGEGDRVFLAPSTLDRQVPLEVIYVVLRHPDGTHGLAADRCGDTEVLRVAYGGRFDPMMRELVGETGGARLRIILADVPY